MFIQAAQPFDFRKSLVFAEAFAPAGGEQFIDGTVLHKAFEIEDVCVLATVSGAPGGIYLTLDADVELSVHQEREARDRVAFYLSLNDELDAFYRRAESDPAFAPLLEAGYGFHQVKFASPFEAACWSILTQRMAVAVARRVKDRIVERFGTSIERDGTVFRAFPSPQRLGRVSDAALLDAGVQERRLRYLRSAIEAFTEVDETTLRSAPTCDVEAWLRKINGIGEWSSQLILLRGLGRMDTFGTGDPLLRAAQAVYGPVNAHTMQMLASMYGEHAGYWLLYLKAVPELATTFSGVA